MIVLHLFCPAKKRIRQSQTWAMLEQLRRHGRHVVIDWPTVEDLDNAAAIAWCWDRGEDLLVLEQDVAPTLEQLVELERCDRALICNQATRCAFARGPDFDFRVRQPDHVLRWGREGEEWANLFPLGCTLFRADAMRLVDVPRVPWAELDTALAMRMLPMRTHVHWPAAEHNH